MPCIGRRIAVMGFVAAVLLQPALAEPPKFQVDPTWPLTLPNNWIIGTTGASWSMRRTIFGSTSAQARSMPGKSERPRSSNVKCCVASTACDRIRSGRQSGAGLGRGRPRVIGGATTATASTSITTTSFGSPTTSQQVGTSSNSPATASSSCASANRARRRGRTTPNASAAPPTWWSRNPVTNELFVADGYGNRRVIVFDATTGAYKRHWGAYGNKPSDEKFTWDFNGLAAAAVHQSGALHHHGPMMVSSWCATASTTACSSSARTAPSCARFLCSRTAIRAPSARS